MTNRAMHASKVEAQLARWTHDIDLLLAKLEDMGPNARVDYQVYIDDLRAKQALVATRLHALEAATPDKWQSFRAGVDKACEDLAAALKKPLERH